MANIFASILCVATLFFGTSVWAREAGSDATLEKILASGVQGGFSTDEPVGRLETNRFYTPVNQVVTPAGVQVELPGLRPQVLALSPSGRLLATSGKTHDLIIIDPAGGKILQTVPLPAGSGLDEGIVAAVERILKPDKDAQVSYTGLVFSPDGSRIFLSDVRGGIKVFSVSGDGKVKGLASFSLPHAKAPGREAEIPAGLAVSRDGKRLYVALNLSNGLAELDAASGKLLRRWEVGVAPYAVVLAGKKVYVSNWGGRRPDADSLTGPAGQGTRVRVDPVRHIASEGSVSVIDLDEETNAGAPRKARLEIVTGLHASAMALSPNGRWLAVCNSGSDTVSVIDTRTDAIAETIWARQNPADLFGAQPNALAFDKKGKKLFVCNGTQNAVAVVEFDPGNSRLAGLIPAGWFPGAIVCDSKRNTLCIANIKGLSPGRQRKSGGAPEFNSHQYHGTISLVQVPSRRELESGTRLALANMRYPLLARSALPPRPDQPPRPVPERAGEPSVFKHVIYIIKENRTYDQVLGDMPEGNGDPSLCIFGERVTPNQHRICRDFLLLDNTYCSGILSADGHQWANSAMATDYMEKSFAGFPRSYPDGCSENGMDALAYSPAGFIWDNAIARGKSLRNYGEFGISEPRWKDPAKKRGPKFLDCYRDFMTSAGQITYGCRTAIESLRPYLAEESAGWTLTVPDVYRASRFIKDLNEAERSGNLPALILIGLPNDHTSGTRAGFPTPAAHVADNDLAFGQIVEALSRSRFWAETCIFAIEDDPQDGWDHVSGYRTTAYVISPYSRLKTTVSTQYNQTSLLRTMELILGLPPMNQMDATATPMFDCFTDKADLTPFAALPANIPLDKMNPDPKLISDPLLRKQAYASARLPLHAPDLCPEDTLNRILWHAMKGPQEPYPAWAVRLVDED